MRPTKDAVVEPQIATEQNRTFDGPRHPGRAQQPAAGHEDDQEPLRQLADRLAHLNLSPESRIRQQLRTRLVAQAERQARWGWPWRVLVGVRPQPMAVLMSAAVLLLVAAAFSPIGEWPAGLYNQAVLATAGGATRLQTEQPVEPAGERTARGQAIVFVALADVRNPAPEAVDAASDDLAPKTTPSIAAVNHKVDLPTPAPVPAPPE